LSHPEWRDTDTGFIATEKVVRLSKKYNRPVNVLHISSKKEIEFLAKEKDKNITVECLPQFLTLYAPDCYEKMGTRAQMNPPVRYQEDHEALIKALKNGVIDVIGSDHAPHTLEEKSKEYPQSPSGMPGVQTIVNLMLDKVLNGVISLDRMLSLLCFKPVEIFKIKNRGVIAMGQPATFTVVDPRATTILDDKDMATKCGWTPYHGLSFKGKTTATVLSGRLVMKDGQIIGEPQGQPLQYQRP
jgi:dihydroorotase